MAEQGQKRRAAKRQVRHEVVFYTYPKFLFCWPLILLGAVLFLVARADWASPEVLAWVYGVALIIVLVTLGFDVDRNYTIFWLVLIGGIWMLIMWLGDVKGVTVFRSIYRFFADLDPVYSPTLGLMVSIVLAVLYAIMWLHARVNSKWRITHNEFEHYQFGRMDDSLARGAKRVSTSYPDFFELVVALAGDLVIYDSVGRRELRRIQHVPMLPLVRRRINELLESTQVTAGEVEDEAEEQEERA